jgi:serine/threonine protein kinase
MTTRSTPIAPPLSVGRYELSGRIGAGQTGMLFRARHTETQNFVAVQLIPSDQVDRGLFDRLSAEFQRALPLEHPNVLRLLDFGREGGYVYLISDWVEGTVLAQMIQAHKRLSEDIAVRLVAQVGQAIDFLLTGNYATYKVRTSNIVLRTDGVAKLVSFAPAAGCLPSSPMPGLNLASSSPLDEPLYDPAKARVEDPVFALGTTLFEMVTGREWTGPQPPPAPPPGVYRSTRRRARAVAAARIPGLSDRVELAIRRATDSDHERRPASAADFLKLLHHRPRATPTAKVDARAVTPDTDNRRAHVRYALGVGSSGTIHDSVFEAPHPDSPKSPEVWPLVVRDLSAGGVGILLARRCEVGTELLIELVAGPDRTPRTLPVRVVRVKRENHGHWAHGCQFLEVLAEDELASLLDHANRPVT